MSLKQIESKKIFLYVNQMYHAFLNILGADCSISKIISQNLLDLKCEFHIKKEIMKILIKIQQEITTTKILIQMDH